MEKYYLMAINLGNVNSIYSYANYHQNITKNYKKMVKYYLMAINLGDIDAMYNYASYHVNITKNYTKMEKYYLMSIKLGCKKLMHNYAVYHQKITKNNTEMEKYYLMAIKLGKQNSLDNLEIIYKNNNMEFVKIIFNYFENNIPLIVINTFINYKYNISLYINTLTVVNNNILIKKLYDKYIINNVMFINSDFKIIAINDHFEIKEYFINSFVLNSKYFEILIYGEFDQQNKINININNFKIIDLLLKYLYLGEIDYENIDFEDINSLQKITDEFQFEILDNICKWILFYKKL